MINLKEESLDDLADLYEFMVTLDPEYCIKVYGFTAEMVANEMSNRENSLINQ